MKWPWKKRQTKQAKQAEKEPENPYDDPELERFLDNLVDTAGNEGATHLCACCGGFFELKAFETPAMAWKLQPRNETSPAFLACMSCAHNGVWAINDAKEVYTCGGPRDRIPLTGPEWALEINAASAGAMFRDHKGDVN